MSEPEYFPEVSNWERHDPDYGSDTTDIWINEVMNIKIRVREVNGPFPTQTVAYTVERRPWGVSTQSDSPWSAVGDSPYNSSTRAERAAYDYATENNGE